MKLFIAEKENIPLTFDSVLVRSLEDAKNILLSGEVNFVSFDSSELSLSVAKFIRNEFNSPVYFEIRESEEKVVNNRKVYIFQLLKHDKYCTRFSHPLFSSIQEREKYLFHRKLNKRAKVMKPRELSISEIENMIEKLKEEIK